MKRIPLVALALAGLCTAAMAQSTRPAPITAYDLRLDTGTKTATATAGAATLNKTSGKVTSEALTTAAGATYTLTVANSAVSAADVVLASLANGSNVAGQPAVVRVVPAAGSITFTVRNADASAALNGTVVVSFAVVKN